MCLKKYFLINLFMNDFFTLWIIVFLVVAGGPLAELIYLKIKRK